MTEKRFIDDGFEAIEDQSFTDNLTKKTYYVEYFDEVVDLCNSLWEQTKRFEKHNKNLMEENEQLKKQLQEFRVEKSNRINAFCVTNDEYSVVLLNENEAYMVCNMINRLIRSCKND